METDRYVIQGGVEGRERLRLLSEVMGPQTRELFRAAGIPRGARCLDLGCGGGDVTRMLADVVGPDGSVLGVDFDRTKLDIARLEVEERGYANIHFEYRDVTEWEPERSFDVIYARFLLSHLRDPAALLGRLRHHLAPGGVFIVEDIDFRGHFAEPECKALTRSVELYTGTVRNRGADPNIGPRLPGLLREAGFGDVRMRLWHPASMLGGIKLLICVTLQDIAEPVLSDGLATEEELRSTVDDLYAFARDPETVLGGPRVFQAWGR